MKNPDIVLALIPVIKAFNKLSVPYYIGGSIASSIYGTARTTIDVDIIAGLDAKNVTLLIQFLEKNYYIDETMITDAIHRHSSFNLIHLETSIKLDIFIQKKEPYHQNAMSRKTRDTLVDDDMSTEFYFSSPEDIIINKLQWYEMGGRVSERQWLDVLGVIKVQGDSLDKDYLLRWSEKLGILSLLKSCFKDSGVQL
jgi:hypothetical protein